MTKSPCQRKCTLDETRRYCRTCLRTLDEIRRWGSMDRSEREKVEVELVRRTIALGIKGEMNAQICCHREICGRPMSLHGPDQKPCGEDSKRVIGDVWGVASTLGVPQPIANA